MEWKLFNCASEYKSGHNFVCIWRTIFVYPSLESFWLVDCYGVYEFIENSNVTFFAFWKLYLGNFWTFPKFRMDRNKLPWLCFQCQRSPPPWNCDNFLLENNPIHSFYFSGAERFTPSTANVNTHTNTNTYTRSLHPHSKSQLRNFDQSANFNSSLLLLANP